MLQVGGNKDKFIFLDYHFAKFKAFLVLGKLSWNEKLQLRMENLNFAVLDGLLRKNNHFQLSL